VIREGDDGDRYYIIDSGQAEVSMSGYKIGELTAGSSFGDRALMRNTRRAATVTATTGMELLTLSREDFLGATQIDRLETDVVRTAELRGGNDLSVRSAWSAGALTRVLEQVPLLAPLSGRTLRELGDVAEVSSWSAGSTLTVQGDVGEHFFVLLDGQIDISVDGSQVTELQSGDSFGEIALLHQVPRAATATAKTDVLVCSLAKEQISKVVDLQKMVGVAAELAV
jgi:CRP-like cAMP-binding protein